MGGVYTVFLRKIKKFMRKIIKKHKKNIKKTKPKDSENGYFANESVLLLKEAVKRNVSDIHILPMSDRSDIYFIIDGDLTLYKTVDLRYHNRIVNILKLYSGLDSSKHLVVQEGQLKHDRYRISSGKEFRVSFIPVEFGEKAVVRVLGRDLISSDRVDLGFTEEDDLRLKELLAKRRGLILLCGVTGSGKTTTIYSFLNNLKSQSVNITTIEDPVEYVMEHITQTEVRPELGYTYDAAIKAVLRQDADILYVGEIRDSETASAALNAAMTGHMVFTSVHSDSIVGAFTRMMKLGVQPHQFAESLCVVICQILVKRVCKECSDFRRTTIDEQRKLGLNHSINVYSENRYGCDSCNNSGSNGRIVAYEMFIPSAEDRIILSDSFSAMEIKKMVSRHGNINDSLLRLLKDGVISIEEAIRLFR